MKTMILADGHIPSAGLGTDRRAAAWLLALAVALAAQAHCLAQRVLFYEDFESVSEWGGPYGSGTAYASWRLENEQAIMSFNRPEPTDPSAVPGWHAAWQPNRTYTFGTNTLEFSIDLVESNRDDAFALLTVNELGALSGYMFGVDRNQAFFCKLGDKGGSWFISYFYGGSHRVTRTNLGLSLAFTRHANELVICSRILDRDNANEVLWQRDIHDTTAQDQVLRNQGWKGLQMDPEGYSPPVSGTLEVGIGIVYLNTQEAPTEPIEVTVDNYTVLQYPAAAISEVHSVLLPWPEDTFDEQIVVGAGSSASDALWTPWPEPIFKRFGELSMAVFATNTQQFFKLVPGTQFIDDFSDPQEPFAVRNPWVPGFYAPADASRWAVTTSNGVLRIQSLQIPVDPTGRLPIKPPGPYVQVKDFWVAVDILNFETTRQDAGIGLGARVGGDLGNWPGVNNGYIGSLSLNSGGVNKAALAFWNGSFTTRGPSFDFKPGTPYRLVFSGVGIRLSIELIDLELQQPAVAPLVVTDSRFSQGSVGFFMEVGAATCDMTLDNFFATGTEP